MDDLVKRLREEQPVTQDMESTFKCCLMDIAAARIEALQARVAAADKLADEVARVCQVLAETNGHAPVMLEMLRAAYEATKEQSE